MSPVLAAVLLLFVAYFIGSIPFGYLAGRIRGVNLFHAGSGNIGATNAGRVLGRKAGILVFILDFFKGVVPVAGIEPLTRAIAAYDPDLSNLSHLLPVGAAVATFLGHLFPITLGFRGGKGVATGAGTVAVLVPVPFVAALGMWLLVVVATRYVFLASMTAVTTLVVVYSLGTEGPFDPSHRAVTAYCLAGSGFVIAKHRANFRRLRAGTESRIGEFSMRQSVLKVIHVLAAGLWFGGAGFFNLGVAPSLFRSFADVVTSAPSDRTAHVAIVPAGSSEKQKEDLGRALAGAAVGPIFPIYFGFQAACGIATLVTAWPWRNAENGRRVHRTRLFVTAVGFLTVLAGWPLSKTVSQLRALRFDPDPAVAASAIQSFGTLHLISLGLSLVTITLAGITLALAAFLPNYDKPTQDVSHGMPPSHSGSC